MKKVVRLTESDLTRIVRRVISESSYQERDYDNILYILSNYGLFPNSEWLDEFEHSPHYDVGMSDDEYTHALYDFIVSVNDEEEEDDEEWG